MATAAYPTIAEDTLKGYAVFWHVWPQQAMIDGESRQVGFELEFMGSHCFDPNHLDPSCPLCHRVRSALLAFAAYLGDHVLDHEPVMYRIDSHSASIVCSTSLANRPCVPVSINVRHQLSNSPGALGLVLDRVKQFLSHHGISEH